MKKIIKYLSILLICIIGINGVSASDCKCSCDSDDNWKLVDTAKVISWPGTKCNEETGEKTVVNFWGTKKNTYACVCSNNTNIENNVNNEQIELIETCDSYKSDETCINSKNNCVWENNTCKTADTLLPSNNNTNTNSNNSNTINTNNNSNNSNNGVSAEDKKCSQYTYEECPTNICEKRHDYYDGYFCSQKSTTNPSGEGKRCIEYSYEECPEYDSYGKQCSARYDYYDGYFCSYKLDYEIRASVSCGNLEDIPAALPVFIKNIINIVKIAVPVILIIMGMLDFAKAVISNDEKGMKESQNKFIKRIIAAIAIFLIVSIVQFIFKIINTNDTNTMVSCIDCFISGNCSAGSNV